MTLMSGSDGPALVPELERVRNLCYLEGKAVLQEDPASKQVFDRLQNECPHVSTRELVLLFHLGDPALVTAAAHRLEYNATHPEPAPEPEPVETTRAGP